MLRNETLRNKTIRLHQLGANTLGEVNFARIAEAGWVKFVNHTLVYCFSIGKVALRSWSEGSHGTSPSISSAL